MGKYMRIIAFSGKMGSGKTEAARITSEIVEKLGFRPVIVKFADPIYKIMQAQCSILNLYFDKPKMRPVMQFIGKHYRKEYGANFWVDRWEMEVKHAEMFGIEHNAVNPKPKEAVYICDDLRYDNEARKISKLKGKIVQVITSDEMRRERIRVVGAEDISEQGIGHPIDYSVYNSDTVENLEKQINLIVRRLYES